MTAFLFRLGRLAHGHPWRVLAAWFLIILAVAGAGFGFGGKLSEGFTIPGTESQTALDRLDAVFPQAAGASAQAVLVAPAGTRIDEGAARTTVTDTIKAIEKIDGIETVSSPFSEYAVNAPSADHRAAIVAVEFSGTEGSVKTATLDALQKTRSIGEDAGMQVAFTGQVFQNTAFGPSITEVFGLAFAAIVLIVTFGSLLAAGMP